MIIGIQAELLKINSLGLLERLLQDKTTKTNILWATDAYTDLGDAYKRDKEIEAHLITGINSGIIKNRARKALEQQTERTRRHAEVFTPLWICRKMNDYADEVWFGRPNVFFGRDGKPTERVEFPKTRRKTPEWKRYVDSRRLEITCGEAPYLVSRYDVSTGEFIEIRNRIGVLDRKLRVVSENAADEEEWLTWAIRAFRTTYGYEFQGDNLLIARINLLMTFEEYLSDQWNRKPTLKECQTITNIIAWNIWQMDGLSGTVPYCKVEEEYRQITLFDWFSGEETIEQMDTKNSQPRCRIYDWLRDRSLDYLDVNTGGRNMKFDFVIGNPPYQDERQGASKTALPVYHSFMEAAYKVSKAVELITPARFLFNAGRTPKAWNEKMLKDTHLKVLMYEKDASMIFANTDIKGGVVITYYDQEKEFGAIETFTIFDELNDILKKMHPWLATEGTLASMMFVASKFNVNSLFKDYPQYSGHERRMSSNVLEFDCFHDDAEVDDIQVYGVCGGKRISKYINKKYVDLSDSNIQKYKIVTPKADGNGTFGDTLASPEILTGNYGFTHTFLGIGGFASKIEAEYALKYIKTKFARTLLGVLKVTQDMNADKWKYVPLQNFTAASDINWSQSIADIDRQLYRKYGLSQEEIDFIETHVKEME